ncbi:hypothetical protein ACIHFE_15440 [Streptomyces sp. NPDC052396]|uniref:hypothetical protein n=1 Tax=Streptomyces sp. NPDC052396 TaxID=3365689 RepID=UPI0037D41DD4
MGNKDRSQDTPEARRATSKGKDQSPERGRRPGKEREDEAQREARERLDTDYDAS